MPIYSYPVREIYDIDIYSTVGLLLLCCSVWPCGPCSGPPRGVNSFFMLVYHYHCEKADVVVPPRCSRSSLARERKKSRRRGEHKREELCTDIMLLFFRALLFFLPESIHCLLCTFLYACMYPYKCTYFICDAAYSILNLEDILYQELHFLRCLTHPKKNLENGCSPNVYTFLHGMVCSIYIVMPDMRSKTAFLRWKCTYLTQKSSAEK